jgi:nucleotide-binding universal stress UspA family protein
MHKILVLIDFTPTSEIAIDQAIAISKLTGATITMSHIAGSDEELESDQFAEKVAPYVQELEKHGVKFKQHMVSGNFKSRVSLYVNEHHPDLVIVGTHGKHGLKQNLFGSNIYDLTKSLPTTLLVVNDFAPVTVGGFKKVLMPVASHEDFLLKVKQTCKLLSSDGEIAIFTITKPGVSLEKATLDNIELAEEYLKAKNKKYSYVQREATTFSVGYSRETIAYASENDFDLISIMSQSAHQTGTEAMDKENILLNEDGIAVLCANQ